MLRRLSVLALVAFLPGCPLGAPPESCKNLEPGQLVISEFRRAPSAGAPGDEYIEIYNPTAQTVTLSGLTLYHRGRDGDTLSHVVKTMLTLPPSSYFVAGDAPDGRLPQWNDYGYGGDLGPLDPVSGTIGLRCGPTIIDEVKYSSPGKEGAARILDGTRVPDATANDDESGWCDAEQEFAPGAYGSPHLGNAPCGAGPGGTCKDPNTGVGRPIVPPTAGQVVITEVMAEPGSVGIEDGQWVEIYAAASVDLNGLVLQGEGQLDRAAFPMGDCLPLTKGEHAVLARQADERRNGGLRKVMLTFPFTLRSRGGTLSILTAKGQAIDQAPYGAAVKGVSSQLDPRRLDATANNDLAHFCPATHDTGGDLGTPGEANSACLGPDVQTCTDALSRQTRPTVPPQPGQLVVTEVMAFPGAVADAKGEWFEVLAKADVDLNGLVLGNEMSGEVVLPTRDCLRLRAGQYAVFAHDNDPALNGGVPAVTERFEFPLSDSGGRITIATPQGLLIDQANFGKSTRGVALQLNPATLDAQFNDLVGQFCAASSRYGGGTSGDFGTPGKQNLACPVVTGPTCVDQASGAPRALQGPAAGDLVITELMPDPRANDLQGEWFEVKVNRDVDLNGVILSNDLGTNALESNECIRVPAQTYALFARSADKLVNGGLPKVLSTFAGGLSNNSDRTHFIELKLPDGSLLDRVTFTRANIGRSWSLSPARTDTTSNDDPTAFCLGSIDFGGGLGDQGSPGAANPACP